MKMRTPQKSVATLAGTAFVAAIGSAHAGSTDDATFLADELDGGYLLAAKGEEEGKCGEGKCGSSDDAKDGAEGKCGEGKCGASGESKDDAEGKCGEGKCGASGESKDDAEGKCGEGKCGSAA